MMRGATSKPSGQCSGQVSSRRIQNQQRCVAHWRNESCKELEKLANTCNKIRSLCKQGKFKSTDHKTIMGYLEKRANRSRKNGRMGGKDIEEIVRQLHLEEGRGGSADKTATVQASEHKAVKEAMEK